jgi:hypothetical protein
MRKELVDRLLEQDKVSIPARDYLEEVVIPLLKEFMELLNLVVSGLSDEKEKIDRLKSLERQLRSLFVGMDIYDALVSYLEHSENLKKGE